MYILYIAYIFIYLFTYSRTINTAITYSHTQGYKRMTDTCTHVYID